MQISQVMTTKPHIIDTNATLFEAAEKMQSFDCGILPVGDIDNTVGVLTDRDILTRAVAKGKDIKTTRVKEIMTNQPFFCQEDDFLQTAVDKMNQHHTRRILVKNKSNQLSGILSLGDIIRRVEDKVFLGELFSHTSVG